jgi:Glycosyl transferase family 2
MSSSSSSRKRKIRSDELETVSIIVAAHNAEETFDEMMQSVCSQTFTGALEVCVFDDMSTDRTAHMIDSWQRAVNSELEGKSHSDVELRRVEAVQRRRKIGPIRFKSMANGAESGKRGPGYARNEAVAKLASGVVLCLLDSDDTMMDIRVSVQYEALMSDEERAARLIVGGRVTRTPQGSTPRYVQWLNEMSYEEYNVLHRYRCVTVIQPTWMLLRARFGALGGYDDGFPAVPEDLLFYMEHLRRGGKLLRVDDVVVCYRHTPDSASSKITRRALLEHRAAFVAEQLIAKWPSFSIWNSKRDGRQFLNALPDDAKKKCRALADIDPRVIGTDYCNDRGNVRVPIVAWQHIEPPFILCVPLNRDGSLERNLESLNFREGIDYFHFC